MSPTSSRLAGSLVFLALVLSGCATSRVPPADANELFIRSREGGSSVLSLHVRENHVVGPNIDLTLNGEIVQGVLFGQHLKIQVREDGVFAGPGKQVFHTELKDGARTMRGIYGGRHIQLRISPTRIEGVAGETWSLEKTGEGHLQGAGIELYASPPLLTKLTEVRLATILTLALANVRASGTGPGGTITSVPVD